MHTQRNALDSNFESDKKKVLRSGDWAEFEYVGDKGIEKVVGWVEYFVKEKKNGKKKEIIFEEPHEEIDVYRLIANEHDYTKMIVHTNDNQTISIYFRDNEKDEYLLVDITPLEPTLDKEDYSALAELALILNDKEMFMHYSNYLRKDVV